MVCVSNCNKCALFLSTASFTNCSGIELCRHLISTSESTSPFFRELGNELFRRCFTDDLNNTGAAAVWAYCLSELLILNPSPPPELVALRSQKGFDAGTFDFATNLRKCLDKAEAGLGTRGRSETAAVFWFRLLPAYSPLISPSQPTVPSLHPLQRSELVKVYSNRYNLLSCRNGKKLAIRVDLLFEIFLFF